MSEKIPVTKAGLEELKKELSFIRVERPNVIEQYVKLELKETYLRMRLRCSQTSSLC